MRATAACDGRDMLETRVILACLRGGVMAHKAAVDGARPTGRSGEGTRLGQGHAARAGARGSGRGTRLGQGVCASREAVAAQRDAVSPRYPELSVQYPTIMCN